MDWDKMLKAARIPVIVLLVLQMLSFVTLARQSYYSYLYVPVILLSYIIPIFVYLYTGYSGVKNYNLKLAEAALTGALMSAAFTVIGIIVTIGSYSASASIISASFGITMLIFSVFGLVTGAIFNGFLALIGGLIAQWLNKKIEVKRNHLLLLGGGLLVIAFFFVLLLVILFYFSAPSPAPSVYQCTFPAGLSCVSSALHTNGSLYLYVGQGTGHTIRVTGVNCTQNTSFAYPTNGTILWANSYNITMPSGSSAMLADPTNSNISITCSDANGKPITDRVMGDIYRGRIYINYTETDTNIMRITVGTYTAKYEQ